MAAKMLFITISIAIALAGCSGPIGASINYPDVAPIVDQSLPEALKASNAVQQTTSARSLQPANLTGSQKEDVVAAYDRFFTGIYPKVSGGEAPGFINAGLEDLDTRMAEIESRFSSFAPDCVSAEPTPYTLDLTQVHPTLTLDMNFYCVDLFGGEGDVSGDGSGMAFGELNGTYSLLLLLNDPDVEEGVYGYAANVSDVGQATERAELITFSSGTNDSEASTADEMSLSHVVATSNASTFEIVIAASNSAGVSPRNGDKLPIGCGFEMVSDGNTIVTEGLFNAGVNSDPACSELSLSPFRNVCLNASDGSVDACPDNPPSFTLIGDAQDDLTWEDITELNIETVYNQVQLSKIQDEGVALTNP